jgi:hypothetical protein
MKKLISILCLGILLIACNDIDDNTTSEPVSVSQIIRKNYNVTNNAILSTTTFEIVDNKIVQAIDYNSTTLSEVISTYNYVDNKIENITSTKSGIITSNNNYVYNSEGQLIEYLSETYDNTGQIQTTNKHIFVRIQDTINSYWTRKLAGSNDFYPIQTSKIVLDENKNRTFISFYDHLNDKFKKIETTYDTNNNILIENYSELYNNGIFTLYLSNYYTYDTTKNPLSLIMFKTLSKETSMLLYHLQPNAINNINVKSWTPNTLTGFSTTFDNQLTFNFNHTINTNNYIAYSEFLTGFSGSPFGKFTYEYIFQE